MRRSSPIVIACRPPAHVVDRQRRQRSRRERFHLDAGLRCCLDDCGDLDRVSRTSSETSMLESGRGWQRGMSSLVPLGRHDPGELCSRKRVAFGSACRRRAVCGSIRISASPPLGDATSASPRRRPCAPRRSHRRGSDRSPRSPHELPELAAMPPRVTPALEAAAVEDVQTGTECRFRSLRRRETTTPTAAGRGRIDVLDLARTRTVRASSRPSDPELFVPPHGA